MGKKGARRLGCSNEVRGKKACLEKKLQFKDFL